MAIDDSSRFENLTFERFRKLASDDSLSKYEKIGFPDSYRKGFEGAIFEDIRAKLSNLNSTNKVVLDVGPGLSDLALAMLDLCRDQHHRLILIDSPEMLAGVPDLDFVTKVPGRFPEDCADFIRENAGRIDAVLTYSVLQYAFMESSVFNFVDQLLLLLAEGGQMLIGDIPNIDKRKRFFSSPAGVHYHQRFTQTHDVPRIEFNTVEAGKIDDAVVIALASRCRKAGFDAYIMPQRADLPLANRREDLFVSRP